LAKWTSNVLQAYSTGSNQDGRLPAGAFEMKTGLPNDPIYFEVEHRISSLDQ